ncbi:MAG: hypothetical protein KC609_06080 [Myxococcales bacterium]|nr:hypothetical protein [Myxococcales bacterium]
MRILFLALVFALSGLSGCGFSNESSLPSLQNGARCSATTDCIRGMSCEITPYYDWTVCSGPTDRGGACTRDTDCKYVRNELGLPLRCLQGLCIYQSDLQPQLNP